MKRYLHACLSVGVFTAVAFLASCSDDEGTEKPDISLSETSVTASSGDEVTVTLDISTDAGFESLVVTKLWDGQSQNVETFDTPQSSYTYTVVDDDADHVLTLNFTVTDSKGRTAQQELVITIELSARQILLKYDWRHNEEIREKTSENEIQDYYTDDVYRFNADGTWQKSIGSKSDGWGDELSTYCYYNLNNNTLRLLLSQTTYDSKTWAKITYVDTLDVTQIDETKLYADVKLYGLDELDATYDPVEVYERRFVAVARASSFDPYKPGSSDDTTGPKPEDSCEDIFDND